MSLVKFRSPFFDLFDEFETIGSLKTTYLPSADVCETDTEFEVAIAAPGFNKSDFTVKVENNSLIISGEKKESEKKYNLRETFKGKFIRSFVLPKEVKVDEITATYTDGILNLKVPKDTTAIKNKLIEIL